MGLGRIIFWSIGNHWYAQWEVMCSTGKCLGAPLEINGVHIVVGVNIIPHVTAAVIYMPFKILYHMNLMCGFCMEGWNELRSL